MTIELIEITKDFFPKKEGRCLVRTESNIRNVNFFLEARVTISANKYSIDVNNQTVTHISKEPLL